jgi:hypothetical protein
MQPRCSAAAQRFVRCHDIEPTPPARRSVRHVPPVANIAAEADDRGNSSARERDVRPASTLKNCRFSNVWFASIVAVTCVLALRDTLASPCI